MDTRLIQSPAAVRVLPFLVFIVLTTFQDSFGQAGRYWIYLAKTIVAAALLFALAKRIPEMRPKFSVWALLAGVGVFALWVGIDGFYPSLNEIYAGFICPLLQSIGLTKKCTGTVAGAPWMPSATFGEGSALTIFFLAVRIAGAALVVPLMEEVFWRSFVYRYIVKREFTDVPLGQWHPISFAVTSVLFGLEHREWLAGILCGCAYQGLVVWKKRLGDAIVAHAITNFLLGVWVIWRGAWQFW